MAVLTLDNITHAFGAHPVLHDVSFSTGAGDLTCLLGPSGCGKTTLLRVAAGLERLQAGKITLGDRIIGNARAGIDLPPEIRGIGMMFQDYALFPHLTLYQNVLFGVPAGRADRRDWARQALERTGLAALADSYPHMLSGGQQQRVALLRALAPEPRVLLLDEPFSGLDVTLRIRVREEILGFLKETGVTTVMVTHDPEEAMFMADRVLVMEEGRVLQSAAPSEIYFHPVNDYVAQLFGPINRFTATVAHGSVDTPAGSFPAPSLRDGVEALVLIRPEGVSLTEVSPGTMRGCAMTVVSARLLGGSTSVRLRRHVDCAHQPAEIQARVPGVFLLEPGTTVAVKINPAQVFVFPA